MKYNVEYIFQPSQKETRKPNPPRVPWKIWSKRGDFCRLCTPGYSSLRLEYSPASEYSLLVARERHAKGRRESEKHAPLCASSRGQLRSPEMESLLVGYANSFSLCTGYLCTARRCIACLLALSSYLENIISDLLFEIFFIKLGRGGKAPPGLASQASLASFWGFFLLTLFNILSWKIDFFSHGDNSLRFLLQNFPSQALQLAPLVNDYLL